MSDKEKKTTGYECCGNMDSSDCSSMMQSMQDMFTKMSNQKGSCDCGTFFKGMQDQCCGKQKDATIS